MDFLFYFLWKVGKWYVKVCVMERVWNDGELVCERRKIGIVEWIWLVFKSKMCVLDVILFFF